MPSKTLVTPVEIVGVKNASDLRINPARKEDIEATPAAQFEQLALLFMEMMQALQPSMNADSANRQKVSIDAAPATVTANATLQSGTITNVLGIVRLEEAGGFGLRNITEAAEARREMMDVAFNTQLSQLVFS